MRQNSCLFQLEIKLHHTWTKAITNVLVVHKKDLVVVRRMECDGSGQVRAFLHLVTQTGTDLTKVPDVCRHQHPWLAQLRTSGPHTYVAHACLHCSMIYVYNIEQKSFYDAFSLDGLDEKQIDDTLRQYLKKKLIMCSGPLGSLFVSYGFIGKVMHLKWQDSSTELVHMLAQNFTLSPHRSMCYVEASDSLITTHVDGSLAATCVSTKERLWTTPSTFLGRKINVRCITPDDAGNLFLIDETSQRPTVDGEDHNPFPKRARLFVLNASDGSIKFVNSDIATKQGCEIEDIAFCRAAPNLMVFYRGDECESLLAENEVSFCDVSWKGAHEA